MDETPSLSTLSSAYLAMSVHGSTYNVVEPGATPLADHQLLQRCRAGDQQAWCDLLDKYERLIYSIPLNYGLAHDDAADIAQLVFLALIQQLSTLREDSNLGGWLSLVARRYTWRVLQQHQRNASLALDEATLHALLPHQTDELERWELAEVLDRNLRLLGCRCNALLTALYFDETLPSYADIAQRLGIAQGSIGPIRARCLQRLQQLLNTTLASR
jgi:RNA polymerase sigma factor (sigma-70 family)